MRISDWSSDVCSSDLKAKSLADLGPIDYLDKDVLVLNAPKYPGFLDPNGRCGVQVSRDRGHSWSPEFPLRLEGLHSISGINSSLVRPDGPVFIFLTEVGESTRPEERRVGKEGVSTGNT